MKYMKRALVTGATGGIGRDIVERLMHEGYVVHAMVRNMDKFDFIKRMIASKHGGNHGKEIALKVNTETCLIPVLAEFTDGSYYYDGEDVKHIRFDVFVAAHGMEPDIRPTETLCPEDWDQRIGIDLSSTFFIAKRVAEKMLEYGSGNIIFISSFHALGTYPERTAYATAKSGLCSLARSLAVEWAHKGIRANAIAPGQVYGDRTAIIAQDSLWKMQKRSPSGTLVCPEDIAETVMWLLRTPSVNGQTIVLDHGVISSLWYGEYPYNVG